MDIPSPYLYYPSVFVKSLQTNRACMYVRWFFYNTYILRNLPVNWLKIFFMKPQVMSYVAFIWDVEIVLF